VHGDGIAKDQRGDSPALDNTIADRFVPGAEDELQTPWGPLPPRQPEWVKPLLRARAWDSLGPAAALGRSDGSLSLILSECDRGRPRSHRSMPSVRARQLFYCRDVGLDLRPASA